MATASETDCAATSSLGGARMKTCHVAATTAALALLAAATSAARPSGTDGAWIAAADREPALWPAAGRDYGDTRYSPLRLIDDHNVGRLRLAWYYDLDTHRGQEATPVVVDGVMYTTSAWSKVQAFRAATGELLWQYDPKVPGEVAVHVCCDVVNRGVAVWNGRVYLGTLDGRLIALDSATGRPLWSALTVDPARPYAITGAPVVAGGKVIIGNAGAEYGVRGYVGAYDARTGKPLWRFYTVPGDPAKGFENAAMRRAARTWTGEWWKDGGGGTVWNSISYDPQLGLLYLGTGNASPWSGPVGGGTRGDALYTSSIVAVHIGNGRYAWHYQTTPGDVWDYDAAQTLTLATLKLDGRERKVVMQAGKNGFFYVLDRASGELLSATAYVTMNWSTGVDLGTGRPVVNPEARYDRSGKLWVGIPGGLGAHNWHPMSYSPQTGLVYIPAQQLPFPFLKDPEFEPGPIGVNMGVDLAATSLPQDPKIKAAVLAGLQGFLLAWDPVAAKAAWHADAAGSVERRYARHGRQPRVPGYRERRIHRVSRNRRREALVVPGANRRHRRADELCRRRTAVRDGARRMGRRIPAGGRRARLQVGSSPEPQPGADVRARRRGGAAGRGRAGRRIPPAAVGAAARRSRRGRGQAVCALLRQLSRRCRAFGRSDTGPAAQPGAVR